MSDDAPPRYRSLSHRFNEAWDEAWRARARAEGETYNNWVRKRLNAACGRQTVDGRRKKP